MENSNRYHLNHRIKFDFVRSKLLTSYTFKVMHQEGYNASVKFLSRMSNFSLIIRKYHMYLMRILKLY